MKNTSIINLDSESLASYLKDPRWVNVELVVADRISKLTHRLTIAPQDEVVALQSRIAELLNITRELESYKGGK